jgi:hypothetical protein
MLIWRVSTVALPTFNDTYIANTTNLTVRALQKLVIQIIVDDFSKLIRSSHGNSCGHRKSQRFVEAALLKLIPKSKGVGRAIMASRYINEIRQRR